MPGMRRGLSWLEHDHPALVRESRSLIEAAERSHEEAGDKIPDSFLWEHTRSVAAAAHRLSRLEKRDPLVPVLCALFHDSGKFSAEGYHADDAPEEETAAALAEERMEAAGLSRDVIKETTTALRSLYRQDAERHPDADIVHDADFLVKSGRMGVAAFFTKAALRGKNLIHALTESLSRELTYAAALPDNMRTGSARKMAVRRSRSTLAYYRGLLRELREEGIARFKIREIDFPCPRNPERKVRLFITVPEICPACGIEPDMAPTIERGIKCEQVVLRVVCPACDVETHVRFCLPETCS